MAWQHRALICAVLDNDAWLRSPGLGKQGFVFSSGCVLCARAKRLCPSGPFVSMYVGRGRH